MAAGTCCGSSGSCTSSCGCFGGPAQRLVVAASSSSPLHFDESSGACRHLILCFLSGCHRRSCYAAVAAPDALLFGSLLLWATES